MVDNTSFLDNAIKKIKSGWSIDDLIRKLITLSDSIEKAENTLFEQVGDIYFLYYPEAGNMLKERDKFINSVETGADRGNIANNLGITAESMGYDLMDEDIQLISMSVNELKNLSDLKKLVDQRLFNIVSINYPNFSSVLGPEIASRMVYLGKKGKLLALMPSSKLQVLGAEKAMFAARRKRVTPKYGVIFNHEALVESDDAVKGKLAKIVAAYSSLAIKTDIFSKQDKSKEIKERMYEEIKKAKYGNKKNN